MPLENVRSTNEQTSIDWILGRLSALEREVDTLKTQLARLL